MNADVREVVALVLGRKSALTEPLTVASVTGWHLTRVLTALLDAVEAGHLVRQGAGYRAPTRADVAAAPRPAPEKAVPRPAPQRAVPRKSPEKSVPAPAPERARALTDDELRARVLAVCLERPGVSNLEVARTFAVDAHKVGEWRRHAGLPSPAQVAQASLKTRRALEVQRVVATTRAQTRPPLTESVVLTLAALGPGHQVLVSEPVDVIGAVLDDIATALAAQPDTVALRREIGKRFGWTVLGRAA